MQCRQEFASWHDTRKLDGFVTHVHVRITIVYTKLTITQKC